MRRQRPPRTPGTRPSTGTGPRDGALSGHRRTHGVFALGSNDPPKEELQSVLAEVFAEAETHVVGVAKAAPGRHGHQHRLSTAL
ncbi:hypothetical protein ACQPZG_04630 (plasmid) [Streptomyces sp. CA-294286]|uniref:hypothetical protein n=1 Tax=Streptomyces sp. CA-294286 TaxID=3240070 RepID=UPI003D904559